MTDEPRGHHEQLLRRKLERLRHLYEQTQNPLYAWEAILDSLATPGEAFIPDWCVPYFGKSALRLMRLASGRDFIDDRRGAPPRPLRTISDKKAMKLLPEALGFSSQGKRNQFAAFQNEHLAIARARKSEAAKPWDDPIKEIQKTRSVTADRAKRIIARSKRLLPQS